MPTQKQLSTREFVQNGRDFVLAAMDDYVRQVLDFPDAKGWRDGDLSALIPHLDAHFRAVASRLSHPDSAEPGSALVTFVEND